MNSLIALLRGVNVGGTGKLPMKDLAAMCTKLGFADVKTYIQSGNVVFRTKLSAEKAGAALEKALAAYMGKPIGVVLRDAKAMADVVKSNPYAKEPGNRVYVLFSNEPVDKALFKALKGPAGETAVPRVNEAYVHYPEGMGQSKLKLPKMAGTVTARNMNTVARLAEMAAVSR